MKDEQIVLANQELKPEITSEQLGKRISLAKSYGIPSEPLVEMDQATYGEVEREIAKREADENITEIKRNNPVLFRNLADRDFYNVAHDELPYLDYWQRSAIDMKAGFKKGQKTIELGRELYRKHKNLQDYNPEREQSLREGLKRASSLADPYGFISQSSQFAGSMVETAPTVIGGAVAGAGAGLVLGPLGIITGAITGARAGAGYETYRTEYGFAYDSYEEIEKETGVKFTDQEKDNVATFVGVTNGLIDAVGFGVLTAPLKKSIIKKIAKDKHKDGFIDKRITELADNSEVASRLGRYSKDVVVSAGTETLMETLQEAVNVGGEEYIKSLRNLENRSADEVFDILAETVQQTWKGALGLGLVGASPTLFKKATEEKADLEAEKIQVKQAIEKAKEISNIKMTEHSPEIARDFIDGTVDTTVEIDYDNAIKFYQEKDNLDDKALKSLEILKKLAQENSTKPKKERMTFYEYKENIPDDVKDIVADFTKFGDEMVTIHDNLKDIENKQFIRSKSITTENIKKRSASESIATIITSQIKNNFVTKETKKDIGNVFSRVFSNLSDKTGIEADTLFARANISLNVGDKAINDFKNNKNHIKEYFKLDLKDGDQNTPRLKRSYENLFRQAGIEKIEDTKENRDKIKNFVKDNPKLFVGKSYKQKHKSFIKGEFISQNGERVINIFNDGDISTIIHEAGHLFLDFMAELYLDKNTNPEFKKEFEMVMKKIGVEIGGDFRADKILTASHEKFARMFEAYFLKGKAPISELRPMFVRFKTFLLNIYESAKALKVNMDNEIVGFFDSLLASEQEIEAHIEAEMLENHIIGKDELKYLDDRDKYKVMKISARDEISQELTARIYSDTKNTMKNYKKEDVEKIEASLIEEPIYRLAKYLTQSKKFNNNNEHHQIDESFLAFKIAHGDPYMNMLVHKSSTKRFMAKEDEAGISVEILADILGYDEPHMLVADLPNIQNFTTMVKKEVTKRLGEDLRQSINDNLETNIKNQSSKLSSVELAELEIEVILKKIGDKKTKVQSVLNKIKFDIQAEINSIPISELKPEVSRRSAERLLRDAFVEYNKGNYDKALQLKIKQFKEMYASHQKRDTLNKVKKDINYLKKTQTKEFQKKVGKGGDGFAEYINTIVMVAGISRKNKYEILTQEEIEDFDGTSGFEILRTPRAFNTSENARYGAYQSLSYLDFSEYVRVVKEIEHNAISRNEIAILGQIQKKEDVIKEMKETLSDKQAQKDAEALMNKKENFFTESLYVMNKMSMGSFLMEVLDNFKNLGVFEMNIYTPMKLSKDTYDNLSKHYANRYRDFMKNNTSKKTQKLLSFSNSRNKIKTNIIKGKDIIDFGEMMSMALNTGTESNLNALLDGYDITEEQLMTFLDEYMTEETWKAVQEIWDINEEVGDKVLTLEKKTKGYHAPKLEKRKVKTKYGEFQGGYVKLSYIYNELETKKVPRKTINAVRRKKKEPVNENFSASMERKEKVGKKVDLNFERYWSDIDNNLYDLAYRENLIWVDSLLSDGEVKEVIVKKTGKRGWTVMKEWFENIEYERKINTVALDSLMRFSRNSVSIMLMGFSIKTMTAQLFGLFPSMLEVGHTAVLSGLALSPIRFTKDYKFASENSATIKHRANQFERDLKSRYKASQKSGAEKFQELSFAGIKYVDLYVSTITWTAGYKKAMNGKAYGIEANNHEKAVLYADKSVAKTQATGNVHDMSSMRARGGEVFKLFTMFTSVFNVYYNTILNSVERAKIQKDFKSYADLVHTVSLVVIIPVIAESLAFGKYDDDEELEDFIKTTLKENAMFTVAGIPIVRDFITSAITGYRYQASPVISSGGSLARMTEGIAELFDDERTDEQDERSSKKILNGVGFLFKLPMSQINRTRNAYDEYKENGEFNFMDLVLTKKKDD